MAIVHYHEQFRATVKNSPSGDIHLAMIEDTGADVHIYPMSAAYLGDLIPKLKAAHTQALGIIIPDDKEIS